MTEKLKISFKDVTDIEKAVSFGAFDNAIKLTSMLKDKAKKEYFFATFFARDITYSILVQLWNISMDKVFQAATKKLIIKKNSMNESTSKKKSKNEDTIENNETLQILEKRYRCTHYNMLFKLPTDEELIDVHAASLFTNEEYQKGGIYLSNNFLCFNADEKEEISLVIPMLCITAISEDVPSSRAFTVITEKNYQFIFSLVGVEGAKNKISSILKEWEISKKSNQMLLKEINGGEKESLPNDENTEESEKKSNDNEYNQIKLNEDSIDQNSSNENVDLKQEVSSFYVVPKEVDLKGSQIFISNLTSPLRLGDYLLLNPKQFSSGYPLRETKLAKKVFFFFFFFNFFFFLFFFFLFIFFIDLSLS